MTFRKSELGLTFLHAVMASSQVMFVSSKKKLKQPRSLKFSQPKGQARASSGLGELAVVVLSSALEDAASMSKPGSSHMVTVLEL